MTISTQCLECKHYTGLSTCKSFPDKIPQEIFDGTFDHTNEYPGDNGIRFEKESIISKGEKIVTVKATSKRKAHKRKISFDGKKKNIKGIPSFDSYTEALKYVDDQSKKYSSKNEFYASNEYKKLYPILQEIHKRELGEWSKDAQKAMKSANVKYGDKVQYTYIGSFMTSELYSGIIIERKGIPYVKLDEGQVTIDGKKSIRWHKGWKLDNEISKGEKIIHIKGSSKVKAHKRKIKITRDLDRIGNGERSHNGTSTDYKESVKNVNNYISKLHENDEGKKILEAMEDYTIDSFTSINEYMKHGESETFKKTLPEGKIRGQKKYNIKDIKDSISNIKKFINDAPKFNGKVYRGLQYRINTPESKMRWDNFIKSIEGSKEMKFGSFLSTSQDRDIAIQFATRHSHKSMKQCIIIIKTKSGIPIEKLSLIEKEREVLLDNDKTYKIIKFEKQDEKNHFLHLEEI